MTFLRWSLIFFNPFTQHYNLSQPKYQKTLCVLFYKKAREKSAKKKQIQLGAIER